MRPSVSVGARCGFLLLALVTIAAIGAPVVAPHSASARFPTLQNAPPTRVHLRDAKGHWRAPFIHPWRLVSPLEQRYEIDGERAVPLVWFARGTIVQSSAEEEAPLLLLGADSYGRDLFSRLIYGARVSLGLALVAAIGAIGIGAIAGGMAGYIGGGTESALMGVSDFMLVLPSTYVALSLRAVLPLVLSPLQVFLWLAGIFAVLGAPFVARSVRAVMRRERGLDYVVAATALGGSRLHILWRHLLPATRGVLGPQLTVLVPGFVISEATLSLVGFGFPDSTVSWGTMLVDAATYRAITDFPWLLSPAISMCIVVLALNLVTDTSHRSDTHLTPRKIL